MELQAGGELGGLAAQERDMCAEVIGVTKAHRVELVDAVERIESRRAVDSRLHGVDRDALFCHLERQRLEKGGRSRPCGVRENQVGHRLTHRQ